MDASPCKRIEIERQSCHERLAFTGFHLGNLALVQDRATNQLDIEMPKPNGAAGRLADGCKRFRQKFFQNLSFFFPQLLVDLIYATFEFIALLNVSRCCSIVRFLEVPPQFGGSFVDPLFERQSSSTEFSI